jgi:UDP-N-acetylglucosamine 1-carboxyvinyltransferase
MDAFVIEGGNRLKGTVRINGAKNSALPLMAAALLTDQPIILRDVPDLSDIRNMAKLLGELGCEVTREDDGAMRLQVTDASQSHARYEIVSTMRASVCVLGPMLGMRGEAKVSMPGGCAIGERPVDLHLRGLAALGAEIELDEGNIVAHARRLTGRRMFLGGPFGSTVLGTANVMSAATLAKGTTVIEQAACEPEVVDLANLLNAMGAKVSGAGTPRITIEGVDALGGADHTVIPDRIEAGTFMMAGAITNGDVELENCPLDALGAVVDRLTAVGVAVENLDEAADPMRTRVSIGCSRRLEPITVTTQPYPGYPTDLQAQLMALLTLADGNSIITEKVYPERFLHVAELSRMGANLYRQGPTVMVIGVKKLVGAPVMASDLRASAGLVLAGLAARGRTTIQRVYHLDRGYDKMEQRLAALGARIERVSM